MQSSAEIVVKCESSSEDNLEADKDEETARASTSIHVIQGGDEEEEEEEEATTEEKANFFNQLMAGDGVAEGD